MVGQAFGLDASDPYSICKLVSDKRAGENLFPCLKPELQYKD